MSTQVRRIVVGVLAVVLLVCAVLMVTGNFGPVPFLIATAAFVALIFQTGDRA